MKKNNNNVNTLKNGVRKNDFFFPPVIIVHACRPREEFVTVIEEEK